ncbi:MAG: hypothetical protein AB1480_11960 [Nitrospirota bacterium]
MIQRIVFRDKIFNPPIPPLLKGGEGGIFTKGGRGGIRGLTLVEVLIALVVVLVVFLALMQTALIGIDSNMRNILRDEAVGIAEMRMNVVRNTPFTSVVSDTGSLSGYDCPTGFSTIGVPFERNLKNISGFDFCTNMTCTELGGDANCATSDVDNKMIDITVGWKWKGEGYTHSIRTIRKR